MNNQLNTSAYRAQLSSIEFKRISQFIQDNYGIKLPEQKKVMVQGRLHKRLLALEMTSFSEYVNYLFSPEGKTHEIPRMVDLISTNKTNFFREAAHFNTLSEIVLPEYIKSHSFSTFKIWSAGCSSGEEVYTLGMVINEFFQNHKGYQYKILGTDISYQMLEKAKIAVYNQKDVETIPLFLKRRYFLKHKNREITKVRIVPELRNKTSFAHLNFMDDEYDLEYLYDVAFCRNVIIYFDRNTQFKVLMKILNYIKPGGYLFLGHSESINDMNLPVKKISPTVFQKI